MEYGNLLIEHNPTLLSFTTVPNHLSNLKVSPGVCKDLGSGKRGSELAAGD